MRVWVRVRERVRVPFIGGTCKGTGTCSFYGGYVCRYRYMCEYVYMYFL